MDTPLVDAEGFPRADVGDIAAIRTARVRVIELRNDARRVTGDLAAAVEAAFAAGGPARPRVNGVAHASSTREPSAALARIDSVSPDSPAAVAGLTAGDEILAIADLHEGAAAGLPDIAARVSSAAEARRAIPVTVRRRCDNHVLTLAPRANWGGRGVLGCHIIPP